MDTQSYSLRREHNRWIVCAAGRELMACADKRTALRIIRAATASEDDWSLSNNRTARTSGATSEDVRAVRSQMPTRTWSTAWIAVPSGPEAP